MGRIQGLGQIGLERPIIYHAVNAPVSGVVSAAAFIGMSQKIPLFWKVVLGAAGALTGYNSLASLANFVNRAAGGEKDLLPTLEIR